MGMTPTTTLITGAASGIGRALAQACAGPGRVLHLGDRDPDGLDQVAAACRERGAETRPRVLDVTDEAGMAAWIGGGGRLDLVVASAGVNYGSIVGAPESPAQVRRIFEINLGGTLNTVLPAIAAMDAQPPGADGRRGRIAVMASLGAFVSAPGAPAYCASKAAVDSWAVGLAPTLRRRGIQLTSICPGYVRTPMTEINPFTMRWLMEPEDAARVILRGMAAGRIRVAFPWRMALSARIGSILPAGAAAFMLARRMARLDRAAEA